MTKYRNIYQAHCHHICLSYVSAYDKIQTNCPPWATRTQPKTTIDEQHGPQQKTTKDEQHGPQQKTKIDEQHGPNQKLQ